mgnify:CR=1 FL=1
MNQRGAVVGRLLGALGVLLFALLGQSSCAQSAVATLVIVEVSGQPMDLQALQVTSTLDGVPARGVETFPGSQTRFGLRFPAGATGALSIAIDALLTNQCLSARGAGSTVLSGQPQLELAVVLMPLVPVTCNGQVQPTLAVMRSGDGGGTVTSMPQGILCGSTCSAAFQSVKVPSS